MARSRNYEFVSDFAKKHIAHRRAEGEAKGRAEGEAQGPAEVRIQVLTLCGFAIDEPLRQRISQASVEQLEVWLAKSVTANALVDVFRTAKELIRLGFRSGECAFTNRGRGVQVHP